MSRGPIWLKNPRADCGIIQGMIEVAALCNRLGMILSEDACNSAANGLRFGYSTSPGASACTEAGRSSSPQPSCESWAVACAGRRQSLS